MSRSAPTSLACCSTSCLSRCHRSSFRVSIEKPMRTGPPAAAVVLPAVDVSSGGAFTHVESRTAPRNSGKSFRMAHLYHTVAMSYALAAMIVNGCWIAFVLLWIIAALDTKRTVYRESVAQRYSLQLLIVAGVFMIIYAG